MVATITPKPIEVFLLVAVGKLGLRTLYELKQGAGLEPGSIRKLIAQLERRGLLLRQDSKDRHGARPMELTDHGRTYIAEHWAESLDPRKEMESVLRSAIVGMAMSDASGAIVFLLSAAAYRERRRGPLEASASAMREGPIELLAETREIYTSRRRAFEATLLRELGMKLAQGEPPVSGPQPNVSRNH